MKAMITDIKRFAVHDGDGIRTTVFFKGCPLRCIWCHNPETFFHKKQMAIYQHKCTNCGKCKEVCPYNMEKCDFCGKCEAICPNGARKIYGTVMTLNEIMEIVLADKDFYDTSGGGITLSGGESLLQADFCTKLLKECKKNDINTAVDTCGFINKDTFSKIIPYTDTFLYDLKAFDEDIHIKCTGVSNKLILDNLKYLDNMNCRIEIRIPYIPEYNDNQIEKLAKFIHTLENVVRVRILPYHNYASSKYLALNFKNILPQVRMPNRKKCEELEKLYF